MSRAYYITVDKHKRAPESGRSHCFEVEGMDDRCKICEWLNRESTAPFCPLPYCLKLFKPSQGAGISNKIAPSEKDGAMINGLANSAALLSHLAKQKKN